MYRSRMVSSSLLAAVLLAGCGSEAAPDVSAGGGSTAGAAVESSVPTTSAPAEPSGDGTVDEVSGGGEPAGQPSGSQGSDADDIDGGTEGLPGWPIESTPEHGAQLWAAYVAVGAPGDPTLQRALEEVQQLWPGAGLGELGCDVGAAEALGRDRAEHAVAVYFDTEQHVTEFRRRWGGPYVGAVQVTTLCAD
jgi:hypothetical protein